VIDGGSNAKTRAETAPAARKPKLLDQVRESIRARHYSPRTEETYVHWIKRFVIFHDKRHPTEMAEMEIARFLSSLATESRVSPSTQNQALNAILFLYRVSFERILAMLTELSALKGPVDCPSCLQKTK